MLVSTKRIPRGAKSWRINSSPSTIRRICRAGTPLDNTAHFNNPDSVPDKYDWLGHLNYALKLVYVSSWLFSSMKFNLALIESCPGHDFQLFLVSLQIIMALGNRPKGEKKVSFKLTDTWNHSDHFSFWKPWKKAYLISLCMWAVLIGPQYLIQNQLANAFFVSLVSHHLPFTC